MDYQQPSFYRFSEDSLWLAKAGAELAGKKPSGHPPKSLLDIGAGCGVVGIECANRLSSVERLTLLEPQKDFLPFIQTNLSLLRTGVQPSIENSDLKNFENGKKYDLVLSNPPYFKEGAGRSYQDERRRICRSFSGIKLPEFIDLLRYKIKCGGQALVLVHRSNPDIKLVEGATVLDSRGRVCLLCIDEKGIHR